ncbi:MAG: hypothetical protein GXP14_01570 [Gammaproteobacteria bacterium]|nr:hypothetical protein [Gammaproteobacteria bacterium]
MKLLSKKMLYLLLMGLMFSFILAGCSKEVEGEVVLPMANEFFAAIQDENYDKALTFYSDDFFNLQTPEDWRAYLQEIQEKLGGLQKVKLKLQQTNTVLSGRRFIFIFTNQYEKARSKETVIFFQQVRSDDIKIQVHKIESEALRKKSL